MLENALDAGARGYVLKDNAAVDVLACLNLVAEGGNYVSPAMSQHLVARRADPRPENAFEARLAELTPSELEVLKLIATGRSSSDVADALGIRPKTVEHHRSHICAKLGITGINALVRFAAEHRNRLS
jgi:DNA-binding NarL/FixJ family response regulator